MAPIAVPINSMVTVNSVIKALEWPGGQERVLQILEWLDAGGGRQQVTQLEAAQQLGLSPHTYGRWLRRLEVLGVVTVETGWEGFGQRLPNIVVQRMTPKQWEANRESIVAQFKERYADAVTQAKRARWRAGQDRRRQKVAKQRIEVVVIAPAPVDVSDEAIDAMSDDEVAAWLA